MDHRFSVGDRLRVVSKEAISHEGKELLERSEE